MHILVYISHCKHPWTELYSGYECKNKVYYYYYPLRTTDYSHTTDVDINEPDSQWAKSVEEEALSGIQKLKLLHNTCSNMSKC